MCKACNVESRLFNIDVNIFSSDYCFIAWKPHAKVQSVLKLLITVQSIKCFQHCLPHTS